ncbi:DUF6230 family protein [Actinacidiphila acididurans]|uniref:Cholesterol esterase n=1 Tax=Actinacidiphila acididurans TaxID=2784346 RepID=A0ABS2TNB2_9ACTN|nr:DUF6230 family protein [Actinacidiphila acididurans]MBM9503735.1 cholesterol esterase [Actinacidiphila acididurans]
MESHVRGGTRWKRFAVVMVPSVAATAAIGVALAQGALAASFSVSGQQFKVTAKTLHGYGFEQYGSVDAPSGKGPVPVVVSAFTDADITGMCQSVVVPAPFIGDVTVKLTAGNDGKVVKAHNLYIDLDQLDADATFTDINIGVATGALSDGPGVEPSVKDNYPGNFAQEAKEAYLTDVKQTAWATSAGTFKLSGVSLRLHKGSGPGVECY